ncbi:hypothetical protein CQW23_17497 [Capsicum baccatum]|uniref:Uncharacterized protein n=1 Tax=Capsicum baccatum TaxID=33114 RepID=A0A2G2WE25_CAPBA|nr:hypothetical protein CQW23_17497 [Capsicum baccatum]
METISQQMRTRGYGVVVTGTRLDANYGLAQCYGRIYLDGCFIRKENYTFYDQYLGPEDRHVCGNRTTKSTLFSQNARRAVQSLYIGCFMRYSDTNFLNAILTSGGSSSREKVIVIVIVVSSIIVLGVCAFIGIVVWKNKQIQKKRKGPNDAEKLVEILHDISLNFKYSTLDKATGSFDEANKLEFDISKLFVASRRSYKTNI